MEYEEATMTENNSKEIVPVYNENQKDSGT